ncbi:hypothetical protein [Clostridium sp. 'White wine YQ']|uniref:hypothetical protein n=1 Tax=Clostridium sp. 'White wine YQ' TaxID=3027474 RepID=UPI002365B440|nr:hypothetical protein [Clostridium sp. 'White wine YQ']MDD7792892.1 hypothetical protein [Clostridium sp. 'White wine YQ']
MDVNSVMNNYTMSSLWKSINPNSNTVSATVPLIENVDSSVNNNYLKNNYFGGTTDSELTSIYKQVEPDYGIPLVYSKSGDLSIPNDVAPNTNGVSIEDSNILALLQSNSSNGDPIDTNILGQYESIENGTYKNSVSSILNTNPYDMYSSVDTLTSGTSDNSGNYINSNV